MSSKALKTRAVLTGCGALFLLGLAWGLWPQPRLGEVVLQIPTEYGAAEFRPAGGDLRLDLRGETRLIAQAQAAELLRINDSGGFYLLALQKTGGGCPTSLIYLMLTDDQIAFSEEFGACLSEIEAYEDWTGIFVAGQSASGESQRYRLEHTGEIRLMPAP